MNSIIYVVTHKETRIPELEGYTPLWVGAYTNLGVGAKQGYVLDSSGENISDRNNAYCELTGLYWMWKNVQSDYIGLVHYRRFFIKITSPVIIRTRSIKVLARPNGYELLSVKEIQERLQDTDVLVRELRIDDTVQYFFAKTIGKEILQELVQAVACEEIEMFNGYLQGHRFVCCNMFIGKKKIIDDYCEWVFPILNCVDEIRESKTGYRYCNRELGYLGEILFGYYLSSRRIQYMNTAVLDCGRVSDYLTLKQFIKLAYNSLRDS